MKDRLVVVATVVAREGSRSLLREALLTLVPVARTEPGFVQYDLHESAEHPGTFLFYEIWEDEASLDIHNTTPAMQAFGKRTGGWVESVRIEKFRRIS